MEKFSRSFKCLFSGTVTLKICLVEECKMYWALRERGRDGEGRGGTEGREGERKEWREGREERKRGRKGGEGGKEEREERRRGGEERVGAAHRSCGLDSLFSEEHVNVLSYFIHGHKLRSWRAEGRRERSTWWVCWGERERGREKERRKGRRGEERQRVSDMFVDTLNSANSTNYHCSKIRVNDWIANV